MLPSIGNSSLLIDHSQGFSSVLGFFFRSFFYSCFEQGHLAGNTFRATYSCLDRLNRISLACLKDLKNNYCPLFGGFIFRNCTT